MLDMVLIMLGIGAACVFIGGFRAAKAQRRLQACIDNGKAQFDSYSVKPSIDTTDSERVKIEREIRIYLHARRTFKTFPDRLYRKNSAN